MKNYFEIILPQMQSAYEFEATPHKIWNQKIESGIKSIETDAVKLCGNDKEIAKLMIYNICVISVQIASATEKFRKMQLEYIKDERVSAFNTYVDMALKCGF
jgi:hypothetical protein